MPALTDFAKAKHLVNSHHGYELEAAIADAFAAERERCAKIAEGMNYGGATEYDRGRTLASVDIANAIRGLGQSPSGKTDASD